MSLMTQSEKIIKIQILRLHVILVCKLLMNNQTLTNDQICYQQHPLSLIDQQVPSGFLHTYR